LRVGLSAGSSSQSDDLDSARDGRPAFYARAAALFHDLALARADGSFRNLLARLSRIDVLVIDDWAMAPLSEPERRDFWEICEDRYQVRSLILTSQLPVTRWHEEIGDPTVADGILDRRFTTPTALRCGAIRCVRIEGRRTCNIALGDTEGAWRIVAKLPAKTNQPGTGGSEDVRRSLLISGL
jgi:hypothetical protein